MSAIIYPATLEWVLASDEPAARWVVLTQLLDRPPDDPEVQAAHRSVLADPGTGELIERLGDWDDPPVERCRTPETRARTLDSQGRRGARLGREDGA